jgi:hypothetical protein
MFEFEENSLSKLEKRRDDNFDLNLGLALSNSIKKSPGSQILSPEEIQVKIRDKIQEFLQKFKS